MDFSEFNPPTFGRLKPVNNITPFTYSDGTSFLDILSKMERYIKEQLVPDTNKVVGEFVGRLNEYIQSIENGLAVDRQEIQKVYNEFTETVLEYHDAIGRKVALINNKTGPVDIQRITLTEDTVFTFSEDWPDNQPIQVVATQDGSGDWKLTFPRNVLGNVQLDPKPEASSTLTLVPLGNGEWFVYQPWSSSPGGITDNVTDALIRDPDSEVSGALREAVDQFSRPYTDTQIATRVGSADFLASADNPSSPYNRAIRQAASLPFPPGLEKWGAKVMNADNNGAAPAKLVTLGSSTVAGMNSGPAGTAWVDRLASWYGSPNHRLESTVSVPTKGIHVFNGGISSTTAANYIPASYLSKIALIKPDVIIHMVGSNDYGERQPLETYRSRMLNAAQNMRTQAPGVTQIFIHQQSRNDISSPAYPWEAYGDILQEVAAEVPDSLYFNVDQYYRMLGLTPLSDRSGLLAEPIHMTTTGHKLMADYVSEFLGTPIKYFGDDKVVTSTFQLSGDVPAAAGERNLGSFDIRPRPYPRRLNITGSVYAGFGPGATNIELGIYATANGSDLPEPHGRAYRSEEGSRSLRLVEGEFWLPANTRCDVKFTLGPAAAYVSAFKNLSLLSAIATPV